MGCGPSKQGDPKADHESPPPRPTPPPRPQEDFKREEVSPYYLKLPEGAEKHTVRNVYDGDTFTLVDERRVRFLGVDTPELKEKQPHAEEAKNYTKVRCHKKEVWIWVDGQDHYGRVLAHVFVRDDGGKGKPYLCVNEGLVQLGLAHAYVPNKHEKTPFNWDKILKLQAQARRAKVGIWESFKDDIVYATPKGSAYHKRSCKHLSKSNTVMDLTISVAADRGFHPCRTCLAEA